jgi:undecaprenyl-diphosphatase
MITPEALLNTISAHPGAAYGVVFLAALAESLAVIGMFLPGVLVMFAAGTLIAEGTLVFWPTLLLAMVGAVSGDSLSYWLGRRYRTRLPHLWPFNRYPAPLEHALAFFARHGGKSVFLGRFIGPLRAMVPLVAGLLDMPPRAFLLANLGSALPWALAYLAPGMLFGVSLTLAGHDHHRMILLTVLSVFLMLLVLWRAQSPPSKTTSSPQRGSSDCGTRR